MSPSLSGVSCTVGTVRLPGAGSDSESGDSDCSVPDVSDGFRELPVYNHDLM